MVTPRVFYLIWYFLYSENVGAFWYKIGLAPFSFVGVRDFSSNGSGRYPDESPGKQKSGSSGTAALFMLEGGLEPPRVSPLDP